MATKKSSKTSKTTKTQKVDHVTHSSFGKLITALGLVIVMLLFGVFYLLGQKPTYAEKQKLAAFDELAESYLYDTFTIEGERGATVTGSGMTDDNDLYYDFIITNYENHIPMSYQKARLHFQCHEQDSLKLKDTGCSYAYWYGDEHETSAEYREKARIFNETTDNYVEAASAAETEEQETAIHEEYKKFCESYKDFNWLGLE